MATAATSLLGLALPVTGELSGTWGDTVNVSITALLDTAVAGTTTLSSDADVTLTTTTLAANQARQAIILWTAGGTVTRTITVPAQSKSYIVINKTSSSQSIKIVGVGPTTGVTIVAGTAAFVVWNGVDFVTVSVTSTTGILPVANGGTGLSSGTSGGVLAYTATGTLASSTALAASALVIGGGAGAAPSTTTTGTGVVTALGVNVGTAGAFVVNGGALGTPSSGTVTNLTGTASININGTVGATTANTGAFTTLSTTGAVTITGGTANGVAYLDASKVLTTGSALTFNGQDFGIGSSSYGDAGTISLSVGVAGTTTGGLQLWGTTTTEHYIQWGDGTSGSDTYRGAISYSHASDFMRFWTSSAEQMRLTSTGLGIGTSSPGEKLTVLGGGATSSTVNFTGGSAGNDNATIASDYGLVFQVDANNTIGSRYYEWRVGGKGYSDGTALMLLSSGGNLGIGTASPQALLHVGAVAEAPGFGTTSQMCYVNGTSQPEVLIRETTNNVVVSMYADSTSGSIRTATNHPLVFFTNNTERARIDTNGNFINTRSIATAYSGTNSATWTNGVALYNSATAAAGNASLINFTNPSNVNAVYGVVQNASGYGDFVWAGYAGSFTEKMRLDSGGNLGIGTATPALYGVLGVAKAITIDSVSVSAGFSDAVTGTLRITHASGSAGINFDTTNLIFQSGGTTPTTRMTLDSSGNLLVGTTNTTPAQSNVAGVAIRPDGISVTGAGALTVNRDSDGIIQSILRSGSLVGNISVTTLLTSYNTTSDYRLKTVVGAVTGAGQRIDALKPIDYLWKEGNVPARGFLAHEFQEVYAGSVSGTKDAVDADGKPMYQAMQASTSEVIADLVAELQSLRARVAQLESKP